MFSPIASQSGNAHGSRVCLFVGLQAFTGNSAGPQFIFDKELEFRNDFCFRLALTDLSFYPVRPTGQPCFKFVKRAERSCYLAEMRDVHRLRTQSANFPE